jgi:hypothetical protein
MTWGKAPQAGGNVVGLLPFGKERGAPGTSAVALAPGSQARIANRRKARGDTAPFSGEGTWGKSLGEPVNGNLAPFVQVIGAPLHRQHDHPSADVDA